MHSNLGFAYFDQKETSKAPNFYCISLIEATSYLSLQNLFHWDFLGCRIQLFLWWHTCSVLYILGALKKTTTHAFPTMHSELEEVIL